MADAGVMHIHVGQDLVIENATPEVIKYCEDFLVLPNPDYIKKERLGKWTGNTPREIWLFERDGNNVRLPYGCWRDLYALCPENTLWDGHFKPLERLNYESLISLYPYQEKAVKTALNARNGVLVMPCGSGKTQCGLELVSRIGGRALWLTHTADLLNQSKARAESVLGQGGYGTITAGKVNIGTHITFATVQTMAKLDLSKYRDVFDVVICDECQHACGSPTKVTQFYRVVSNLAAKYKYGLTATPKRADGLERSMFALLGSKICEITREEVAHTTCQVKLSTIETGWTPDFDAVLMGDGTIDYNKVIDNMIHDEKRYSVILEQLKSFGKMPTMVLANRVEYLQKLCHDFNEYQYGTGVCLSGRGQSKAAREERKAALNALNTGEIDCIFATYALAKEGLDVPNLRHVVFATPEQDETTVIQAAGRVGRKADGKDCGIVFDFVDNFGMYRGWYKKRLRYYKKIGMEIDESC